MRASRKTKDEQKEKTYWGTKIKIHIPARSALQFDKDFVLYTKSEEFAKTLRLILSNHNKNWFVSLERFYKPKEKK